MVKGDLHIFQNDDASGAWQCEASDAHKRYTVYVKFTYGDEMGDYSIEEIDVNARHPQQAREIATQCLKNDYEPGGEIIEVREQIGWYM
jgi:hypothetical protein